MAIVHSTGDGNRGMSEAFSAGLGHFWVAALLPIPSLTPLSPRFSLPLFNVSQRFLGLNLGNSGRCDCFCGGGYDFGDCLIFCLFELGNDYG